MEKTLTTAAIGETVGNDGVVICSRWARLGNTVTNAILKGDILAQADRVRCATSLRWAAERRGLQEHATDTGLLKKVLTADRRSVATNWSLTPHSGREVRFWAATKPTRAVTAKKDFMLLEG